MSHLCHFAWDRIRWNTLRLLWQLEHWAIFQCRSLQYYANVNENEGRFVWRLHQNMKQIDNGLRTNGFHKSLQAVLTSDMTLSRVARKTPSAPKSIPKTTPGIGICLIISTTSSFRFRYTGLEMLTNVSGINGWHLDRELTQEWWIASNCQSRVKQIHCISSLPGIHSLRRERMRNSSFGTFFCTAAFRGRSLNLWSRRMSYWIVARNHNTLRPALPRIDASLSIRCQCRQWPANPNTSKNLHFFQMVSANGRCQNNAVYWFHEPQTAIHISCGRMGDCLQLVVQKFTVRWMHGCVRLMW